MHTRVYGHAWEVDTWLHLKGRQVLPAQQDRVTSVFLLKLIGIQIWVLRKTGCESPTGMGHGMEAG